MRRLLFGLFCGVFLYFTYQGHQLRQIGYERIPDHRIFDERNYALQGLSIRRSGIPMAWSDLTAYERSFATEGVEVQGLNITMYGQTPNIENYSSFSKPLYAIAQYDIGKGMEKIRFVQPFFDHPPIGGLITSLGVPKEASDFSDIKPEHYRKPMLFIALITSLLIFIFALINYSALTGIIAVGIYNSLPVFVLSSKFALLENILTPIALLGFILLSLVKRTTHINKRLSNLLWVCSALILGTGVITKETGLGFLIAGIALLMKWKYPGRKILAFFFIGLIPLGLYFVWGMSIAPEFFLEVVLGNADRQFYGPLNFVSMLATFKFEMFPIDGWWMAGFASLLLVTVYKIKNYKLIVVPALSFILLVLFLSNLNYPWYWLPLVPYLAIALGLIINRLIFKPTFLIVILFALLPLSSSLYWGQMIQNVPLEVNFYRLVVFGLITLGIIRLTKVKTVYLKYVWIIFVVLILMVTYRWNRRANNYMLFNWGNLPQQMYFQYNP